MRIYADMNYLSRKWLILDVNRSKVTVFRWITICNILPKHHFSESVAKHEAVSRTKPRTAHNMFSKLCFWQTVNS